ncbi:MAG: hypothetical protein ACEPOV_06255 [Hyphomicrobiales bacterium]
MGYQSKKLYSYIKEVNEDLVKFTTANNITYSVFFEKMIQEDSEYDFYEIAFEKDNEDKFFDSKIQYTIVEIIREYLTKKEYSILYYVPLIDDEGSGAEARGRLFQRWHRNSNTRKITILKKNILEFDFNPEGCDNNIYFVYDHNRHNNIFVENMIQSELEYLATEKME